MRLSAVNGWQRARGLSGLAVCLLCGMSAQAQRSELGERALAALGGADRLARVEAIETTEEAVHFSAMYNAVAGGAPVHLSNARTETVFQPASGRFLVETRLDAFHPFVESFHYRDAFDGQSASRAGPADYRRGDGAQTHGVYLGAMLKRLRLEYPQWLLREAKHIEPAGVHTVRGRNLPTLSATAYGERWIVSVDPDTDLPQAVTVRERHGFYGSIEVRVVYSDWRDVEGVRMPFRLARYNDGVLVRRVVRESARLAPGGAPERFRLADSRAPSSVAPGAREWGWRMSHWFLGRTAMGRGTETRRSPPVTFNEVGEGLYQVAGSSHHSFLVVDAQGLVIVDAPFYPARSRQVLAALAKRWPDKPVRHLVLTHHHLDHSGGLHPYMEAGAELVIAESNAAFFRGALARGGAVDTQDMRMVRRRARLPGLARRVEVLRVPNPHSDAMLAIYLPEASLLFVTDLFSPGRPTEAQNTRYAKVLLHAIRYYGVDVRTIVGGHGAPSAPLAALEAAAR